jgi:toxin ParE1/3/4
VTKPCLLRPLASQDRRDEIRYYRKEAGSVIAMKLVDSLQKALLELERNPAIGSPVMGQALGIDGLRVWRIDGFPLSFWYFERLQHIDVARLVGHRQDAELIELD